MGRKSKRLCALAGTSKSVSVTEEHYKAGVYARLSVNKEEKNESIDTQVEIAEEFVRNWNDNHAEKIRIAGYYKDLGKTGVNFERDAFKRLMQDVRLGEINCIIVKDLSRFGRNYLEAGSYIEKVLPFFGVRFIAVTDGYDTGAGGRNNRQETDGISLEIKNLVNDMYAKDISVKARASLEQRRKEGSYVGGPPPYGYLAVKEGKIRKLIPDEKTAGIVRAIFVKFVETKSYKEVADALNRQRINPPSIYRKSGKVFCPADTPYKGWDKAYMEVMLGNETYIGRLAQGKTSISAQKERKWNAKEEWIVKENTHEPLIEARLFEEAKIISQEIHNKWKNCKHHAEEYPVPENVFEDVLFCGVCGRKMTRHSHVREHAGGKKKRAEEYLCLNSGSTKIEKCPSYNFIQKNTLAEILFSVLEMEFSMCLKKRREYERKGQEMIASKKKELEQKLNAVQRNREKAGKQDSEAYVAYRTGRLSFQELTAGRQQREERQQEFLLLEAELQKEIAAIEQREKIFLESVKALVKLKKNKVFTKELVNALIEKIYVYPGKRVEVVFAFRETWKKTGAAV